MPKLKEKLASDYESKKKSFVDRRESVAYLAGFEKAREMAAYRADELFQTGTFPFEKTKASLILKLGEEEVE